MADAFSFANQKSKFSAQLLAKRALPLFSGIVLAGCSVLPAAGPSTRAVSSAGHQSIDRAPITVVDVTDAVTGRLMAMKKPVSFSDVLTNATEYGSVIGRGDALDITVFEAPPAVLFGSTFSGNTGSTGAATQRPADLPGQVVGVDGRIDVPFAGQVEAAGLTPQQVAREIRAKLAGKAHDPQVIVRLARNTTSAVTILGDVASSGRVPLSTRGERLLDLIASVGGVRQPVGKTTIQVTRGAKVEAMPLEAILKDPRQNVRLQADDVVTVLFMPYSFTVLGAARANQEIPFEGTGLTLSQALGRMGGLADERANAKGVFIFRFEDPEVFAKEGEAGPPTKDGKVPVIYRVNMRDAKTLFVAQSFPVYNKDVIYVSNAPLADFNKFLQAVSQIVYPIAVIQTSTIF
jgi:polysaccharide export outer membrane protein